MLPKSNKYKEKYLKYLFIIINYFINYLNYIISKGINNKCHHQRQ